MTQEQYNTICEILKNGAPALAASLIASLTNLVRGYQELVKEITALKSTDGKNENEGE